MRIRRIMNRMGEFKIVVRKGNGPMSASAQEIPSWFLDHEAVAPCPCGRQPDEGSTFIYEGGSELKRWFHKNCAPIFLRHEMNDDEMEQFMEWKRDIEE